MTRTQISKAYEEIEGTCTNILADLNRMPTPHLQTVLAVNSIMLDAQLAKDTPESHHVSLTRIQRALTDIPASVLLRPALAVSVLVLSQQK